MTIELESEQRNKGCFQIWMVQFYSVLDSKSGIQFGFKPNLDSNNYRDSDLDFNFTMFHSHTSAPLH